MREIEYPTYSLRAPISRTSWGAIFGGAFVANAILGLLSLLGLGIGLVRSATAGLLPGAVGSAGTAGGVWLFVTAVVSFYIGGWVIGRLTHSSSRSENAIQALVAWSLSALAVVLIVGSALTQAAGGPLGPGGAGAAALGGIGLYVFVLLACEAIGAMLGGAVGTRLLRPVVETRRHRVEEAPRSVSQV